MTQLKSPRLTQYAWQLRKVGIYHAKLLGLAVILGVESIEIEPVITAWRETYPLLTWRQIMGIMRWRVLGGASLDDLRKTLEAK